MEKQNNRKKELTEIMENRPIENRPIEQVRLTERISYIPASEEPLSADVILVDGDEFLYVFDVGNSVQVAEYINSLPKKKRVILSHFHPDHMGNIGKIVFETVFCGGNTEKYLKHYIDAYPAVSHEQPDTEKEFGKVVCVSEKTRIRDGILLEIYPIPCSHAKGSLLLMAGDYLFLGDALYCQVKGDSRIYNAQLVQEEIRLLKELPAKQIFSSHEKRPIKPKMAAVRFLEQIYAKREKNIP